MIDLLDTFADELSRVFAVHNISSMEYAFSRRQNLRGIPAFVIDFKTKKGRTSPGRGANIVNSTHPDMGMKGKAWIDSSSMQVIRLEFEEILPNHPATGALFTWKTVADYGAVRIGEKEFWLLTKMVKSGTGGEWIADYSNCRKFEVTTTIRPAD